MMSFSRHHQILPIVRLTRLIVLAFIANPRAESAKNDFTNAGASTSRNFERIENITKLPNDHRSYRGLKLNNGMNVLLISDPSTRVSAASMVVGVGALNDFRDQPGLANLVGSMLLKGGEKLYNFSSFVKANSGRVGKPLTRGDDQIFSFEIVTRFSDALDKFAKLFKEPLLTYSPETILEDSLKFVHSEFLRRSTIDSFRITQAEKAFSKENHPYNHLFIDSPNILWDFGPNSVLVITSVCDNVRKFHSMWYSSNIMNLVVLGKATLDDLEEMVVPLFETIKNNDAKKMSYSCKHHPWGPQQMKQKIHIVPLDDNKRELRIHFPIPDVRSQHYKTAPESYVNHFIVHDGEGALLSVLKKRSLCTKVQIHYKSNAGIAFFTIVFEMTTGGLKNHDEIIDLLFKYIHLLRMDGIREEMFYELKKIQALSNLEYKAKENPLVYVGYLATRMQVYSLDELLTHGSFPEYWQPLHIEEFLSYLRPDNVK